jgi:hypothetical protein
MDAEQWKAPYSTGICNQGSIRLELLIEDVTEPPKKSGFVS